MSVQSTQSILFVCLGNICRSPTAHGVFQKLANDKFPGNRLVIDSAGTSAHHVGETPDTRSMEAAAARGYDLGHIRSRQVAADDFKRFDLILAMDKENQQNLLDQARRVGDREAEHKIKLFLDFATRSDYREVPDPYYGGSRGFDLVIDLIEDAGLGLIASLDEKHRSNP